MNYKLEEYNIKLSRDAVINTLQALLDLPAKFSMSIIQDIQVQIQEQNEAKGKKE